MHYRSGTSPRTVRTASAKQRQDAASVEPYITVQLSSYNHKHDIGHCTDKLEMPAGRLGGAQGGV